MSDQKGKNRTLLTNKPTERADVTEMHGRVRTSYDSKTLTSELAIGDKLEMGNLPRGAKLLGVKIKHDDLGTTGILKLSADGNDLVTGIDVKAAADVKDLPSAFADDLPKDIVNDGPMTLEATEATDAGTGKVIELWAEYVVD